MTIWESAKGNNLCDIAIIVLKKLQKRLDNAEKKPVQYARIMPECEVNQYICDEICAGSKFITCNTVDHESVVVMECQVNNY